MVHGATASAEIDVYSHVRRSTFKTLDWGCRVQGPEMAVLGEDGIGFNLLYGDYRQQANTANAQATLRGGADYMQCCTMSGGHQMDLRSECDWSDPLVVKGGSARAAQQAFFDRTKANALGVHFYDEPGLTWENGTPHTVSAQLRAFKSAFGDDRIAYTAVKPGDADADGPLATVGTLEDLVPGGRLERRPLRRRASAARPDLGHAISIRLERLRRRLLLQRRPQPAGA